MVLLALLIIARFAAYPFLRWLTTEYTITNRRVITRVGLVTRVGRDMPLARINDVHFEHSNVVERMLGCGTLVVESAGERGQLVLADVPEVEIVQREVYRLYEEDDFRRRTRSSLDEPAERIDGTDDARIAGRRSRRRPISNTSFLATSAVTPGSRSVGWPGSSWPRRAGCGEPWALPTWATRRRSSPTPTLPRCRLVATLRRRGVLDLKTTEQLTRALGRMTGRLVEWQIQTLVERVAARGTSWRPPPRWRRAGGDDPA